MVRRFQNAGFTLTELIVVLILAGIMAAVAIPRLGGENVFRERGFHDAVVAALGHARKVAVASRRFVCARVDGAAGTLTFTRETSDPDGLTSVTCPAGNPVNLPARQKGCSADNQVCAPSGVLLNNGAGSTDFLFDPQGRLVSPSAPRTVDVDVVLNVSGQADITVRAQSGYAQ